MNKAELARQILDLQFSIVGPPTYMMGFYEAIAVVVKHLGQEKMLKMRLKESKAAEIDPRNRYCEVVPLKWMKMKGD